MTKASMTMMMAGMTLMALPAMADVDRSKMGHITPLMGGSFMAEGKTGINSTGHISNPSTIKYQPSTIKYPVSINYNERSKGAVEKQMNIDNTNDVSTATVVSETTGGTSRFRK